MASASELVAQSPLQYHANNAPAISVDVATYGTGDPDGLTVLFRCEKRRLGGPPDDENVREPRVCELTVRDMGEPGRGRDTFHLTTPAGFEENDGDQYNSDTLGAGSPPPGQVLNRGNIQAHIEEPPEDPS